MKKILILGFISVFSVNVSFAEVISTLQMQEYEQNIKYLECVYSKPTNNIAICGNNPTEPVRDVVSKYRKIKTVGMRAAQKKRLDKKADYVLSKVNSIEGENFIDKLLSGQGTEALIKNLDDDIVITTTKSVPSPAYLEGVPGAKKTVKVTQKQNKQQILDLLKKTKSFTSGDEIYTSQPDYVKQMKNSKINLEKKCTEKIAKTVVTCKALKTKSLRGKFYEVKIVTRLSRFLNGDFKIEDLSYDIDLKEYKQPAKKEKFLIKKPKVEFGNSKIEDKKWQERFDKENAEVADADLKVGSMAAIHVMSNTIDAKLSKIEKEKDKDKIKKHFDDILKYEKEAKKVLHNLKNEKDFKSNMIRARFEMIQDKVRKLRQKQGVR